MTPQSETGNRFGWLGGSTAIIGSIIVGLSVPVQFYRITAIQGMADFDHPGYLFFFFLTILLGIYSPATTAHIIYRNSVIRDRIEQRWYNFLLSRPLVQDSLSQLRIRISQLSSHTLDLLEQNRALSGQNSELIHRIVTLESEFGQRIALLESQLSQKEIDEKEVKAREIIGKLPIKANPGFIYVMRREDGILKVGRTNDTERRLSQHAKDYGSHFELMYRFVVPDAVQFEKLALRMTRRFEHKESGRIELRSMADSELEDFILLFHRCCITAVDR